MLEHALALAGSEAQIVKDLSKEERIQLAVGGSRSSSDPKQRIPYQNWGLTNPQKKEMGCHCGTTKDLSIRSYSDEPLTIAAGIVDRGAPIAILERLGSTMTHSACWQVNYNGVLPVVSKEILRQNLGTQISAEELENWDCVGLRFTSNLLRDPASSMDTNPFDSIAKVLNLLRGSNSKGYRTFVTDQCGINMRLGIDQRLLGQEGPGRILQHLAYILFLYEDVISSFHPPNRRGYKGSLTEKICASIREPFLVNFGILRSVRAAFGNLNLSRKGLPPFSFIQQSIFSSVPDTKALATLLGQPKKESVVHWANLEKADVYSDKSIAKFIEFRHHEATLDPLELEHWIRFIVALLNAAQIKAAMPTPRPRPGDGEAANWECEVRKYNIATLEGISDDPMNFMYFLNLDSAAQEYWMRRYRRFSGISDKPVVRTTHDRATIKPISRLRQRPVNKQALFGCDCDFSSEEDTKTEEQIRTAHFNTDPVSDVRLIPSRKRQLEEQTEEEQESMQPRAKYRRTPRRRRRIETPEPKSYTKKDGKWVKHAVSFDSRGGS